MLEGNSISFEFSSKGKDIAVDANNFWYYKNRRETKVIIYWLCASKGCNKRTSTEKKTNSGRKCLQVEFVKSIKSLVDNYSVMGNKAFIKAMASRISISNAYRY